MKVSKNVEATYVSLAGDNSGAFGRQQCDLRSILLQFAW